MKFYAFYLPQFHPISENNEWWGKGFTEWTNVTKSKALYNGHYQPQLPADMGFYDLRCPEVKYEQANLAKNYGVDGFIYYHYWFHGKRLLNKPIDDLVTDNNFKFPFALCWANETWARTWDGLDHEVLIKQEYSNDDHVNHAKYLAKVFLNENYIRVDNKPLFLIYRPAKVEGLSFFISCLVKECQSLGLSAPHLSFVRASFSSENKKFAYEVADSVVDFQPNSDDFPPPVGLKNSLISFSMKILPNYIYQLIKRNVKVYKQVSYAGIVDYKTKEHFEANGCEVFPCCFPSWDNSPRRSTPTIIQNEDPEKFKRWLKASAEYADKNKNKIVFINAWNEWAEGCHLEPDQKMGDAFLKVVRNVKEVYQY